MALDEETVVDQLKQVGSKLSQPPTSNDDLLTLIGNLGIILKKVNQCPSLSVQEALLPIMKALFSDSFIKNSMSDIKTMVAVCFNEITRITAPIAPYDDNRMKEVIELIVASFDNLSLLSGRSYDEAVSILQNVAKVKSCVMMLDLECEKLIIKMFEQFLGNLSSDHPHSVFSAMETIMTIIIDESDCVSLDLLKVLLGSVCKENEEASSMSSKLGAKVISNTAKKLKPYVRKAMASAQIDKDDYGTLISSIFHCGSEAPEANYDGDLVENMVVKVPAASTTSLGNGVQSGLDATRTDKSSNMSENSKKMKPAIETNSKAETEPQEKAESAFIIRKRKLNSPESAFIRKVGRPKKNVSEGSENKSVENSREKDKEGINGSMNKVFETPYGRKTYEEIVGFRIKVWWVMDSTYYEGQVASYNPLKMTHRIEYDDGEVEHLRLAKEKFKLL